MFFPFPTDTSSDDTSSGDAAGDTADVRDDVSGDPEDDTTEPDVPRADAPDLGVPDAEPDAPEPDIEPDTDGPDAPEPDIEPDTDEPDAPEPDVEPDTDEPDAPEPDVEPDTDEPDAEPDVGDPLVAAREAVRTQGRAFCAVITLGCAPYDEEACNAYVEEYLPRWEEYGLDCLLAYAEVLECFAAAECVDGTLEGTDCADEETRLDEVCF